MASRPRFIGSEIYRRSTYGGKHPLAIPRVSAVIDMTRAMGWLPDDVYIDSPRATPEQLARFHHRTYIDAVIQAEIDQRVSDAVRRRHNIGANGNPVYREMFRRPATACGASIHAATLLTGDDGSVDTVHNPAGGTHHGRPDRASGFCYFNDPVLGILTMIDRGLSRIYYVDVDAHHGDGVQDAFSDDDRVLTVSIHEAGRWPRTGLVEDRAGGHARNLPVPAGFNDSEMAYLIERVVLPLGQSFAPEAVVIQCGADGLADDPMSKLSLSNNALWNVIKALRGIAPRLLVLGGGGYNPWAVARCWAGVWATLNDIEIPDRLPPPAEAILRGLWWNRNPGRAIPEHWLQTMADPPHNGEIRHEVRRQAELLISRVD